MLFDVITITKIKKSRGLPGIEPGTASTLKKNHTTRPKPQLIFLDENKKLN